MLSTTRGTIALGVLRASRRATDRSPICTATERASTSANEPVTVLVAKGLIDKGTPGNVVGQAGPLPGDDGAKARVKDGAITDPVVLRGLVSPSRTSVPGQQLTTADFAERDRPDRATGSAATSARSACRSTSRTA